MVQSPELTNFLIKINKSLERLVNLNEFDCSDNQLTVLPGTVLPGLATRPIVSLKVAVVA